MCEIGLRHRNQRTVSSRMTVSTNDPLYPYERRIPTGTSPSLNPRIETAGQPSTVGSVAGRFSDQTRTLVLEPAGDPAPAGLV